MKVVNLMTTGTERCVITNFSSVLAAYVRPLYTLWCGFSNSALTAYSGASLLSLYPVVNCTVASCVSFPVWVAYTPPHYRRIILRSWCMPVSKTGVVAVLYKLGVSVRGVALSTAIELLSLSAGGNAKGCSALSTLYYYWHKSIVTYLASVTYSVNVLQWFLNHPDWL